MRSSLNKRTDAFGWGLRGFLGYVVGCAASEYLFLLISDRFVYVAAALICVVPGLCWGLGLGNMKMAAAGAATHSFVAGAIYVVVVSGAGNFFESVVPYSSRVGFAIHAGLFLGLVGCLIGLGAGALLGQLTGKERSRGTGARLGARVGLYMPLAAWVILALTLRDSPLDWERNALFVVPVALCIGATLFGAMMGREHAAQAARGQANA